MSYNPSSGGGSLTDTQLRATPLSVTGTFYQATQPISAASLPLPSGAATETTLAALNTKTPALGQATMANSSPVVIASNQGAVPVSGTFWQTTQPVSGPLTDTQLRASAVPVSGTFWQATQPVSGTFWQATQPVSIAATVAVSGPLTDTQLRASAVPVSLATLPALTAGAAVIGAVTQSGSWTLTPPTLTKATQGTTGFSTQDLKDAGRAIVNAATAIAGVVCVTSEAMLALNVSRDGAATASATSITVTAGKRFRITGLICGCRSSAAAVLSARVALRLNPSGAAVITSPIIAIASMSQQAAALAEAGDTCVIMFADGIEISGTMQVGLSQLCSATTGVVYASLIGYEY